MRKRKKLYSKTSWWQQYHRTLGRFSIKPPTNRPPTYLPTDQMHRPPTNLSPTSKKFEDQKKSEFIFDKTMTLNRVFEIMLCMMHPNAYVWFLTNNFPFFFQGRLQWKNCHQKYYRRLTITVVKVRYYRKKKTYTCRDIQ